MENRRIRHEATRACRLVASRNFLIGIVGILPGEKCRGRVFRPLPELKLMDSVQLSFPAGLVGFQPLHHIPAVWAETDFLRAFLFRIEYFEQFFLPAAAVAGHKSTPSGNWYFYPTTLPAKMQRRTHFLRLRKVLFQKRLEAVLRQGRGQGNGIGIAAIRPHCQSKALVRALQGHGIFTDFCRFLPVIHIAVSGIVLGALGFPVAQGLASAEILDFRQISPIGHIFRPLHREGNVGQLRQRNMGFRGQLVNGGRLLNLGNGHHVRLLNVSGLPDKPAAQDDGKAGRQRRQLPHESLPLLNSGRFHIPEHPLTHFRGHRDPIHDFLILQSRRPPSAQISAFPAPGAGRSGWWRGCGSEFEPFPRWNSPRNSAGG